MSVEDTVKSLLEDMGMWWPDADSGKVRGAATSWRTFADAVDKVATATDGKAAALIHNNTGEAIDAFAVFWGRYRGPGGKGWLNDLAGTSRQMAVAVDDAINKLWTEIGVSAAVIAAGVGLAVFTFGISTAASAAAATAIVELAASLGIGVSAIVAEIAGATLAGATIAGIESVTIDLAVAQPLKIATGLQEGFNLDELSTAAKDGMLYGGVFGTAGGTIDAAATRGMSPLFRTTGIPNLLTPPLERPPGWSVLKRPTAPSIRPNGADLPAGARRIDNIRCALDPIDVATGTMLLPQTDVTLPGALPLLFERTHLSSYRAGGWFGPSWASTLDERLQLDAEGIVYAAADGMRLVYPVPTAGAPALPERGPRWPLAWDGRPDGVMTLTDPATGHVRTFGRPARTAAHDTVDLPLDSIEDRAGHRIDIDRTPTGVPTAIRHSGGYHLAVDTHGPRITALRLLDREPSPYERPRDTPGTVLVRYGYDHAGRLTEVTNSSDVPLRFTYDTDGRITSWTDRNGSSYTYVYDTRGRVIATQGTDGLLSGTLDYDDAARTTTVTNSLGHQHTYRHDATCQVVAETDPLGNTTATEWDPLGEHPLAVTDPLGHTTRYAYDATGRLTGVSLPDGTTAQAAYNALGLPTEVIEPGGATWRHTYDATGNVLATVDPTGAETAYAYDSAGHLASVTDALGHVQHVICDPAGLPTAVTDPLGHTTAVRRNTFGRITEATNPLGHTTFFGWTTEGKPAWRELPDGARETWDWDGEGNCVSHTGPAGNTTHLTSGAFDLPTTRTDPDGATYAFTHDTELRLTGVTNPQGLTWSYAYDPAGRVTSETDFNGRTLRYTHDAGGRLTTRTNGAGETLTYTRDPAGRPLLTSTDDGSETRFCYDAAGFLTGTGNRDATLTWERDALGRVLTQATDGRAMTCVYDALGRRTRRTTPTGAVSHWTYDAAGRPTALRTDAGTLDFAYDAAGRETGRRLGEHVELTQTWDSADRLATQTVTHLAPGADLLLQHRTYSYRADGHLTEFRDLASGTRRFTLDPVGRVTAVTAHGWSETYAYDSAGNQAHANAPGHASDGDRAFTGTLIQRAGRTHYTHDAQGRLTRRTRKLLNGQSRTWTYTWNAEDRLTDTTTPDGESWHYTYDPLGRRTTKQRRTHDGTIAARTTFTWDDTRLAEQTTGEERTTTWDYAPGTHRPLTQTDRETPATGTTSSLISRFSQATADPDATRFHAIITDLTGTPTELVTTTGHITWQHAPRSGAPPSRRPPPRAPSPPSTVPSDSPASTMTPKPA
ncbi:DUF6531 domain-containing protein [Streptomyces sp. H10-C2]|uniref:DUF6531 domain-containing protein n=1 Tax=unclassified Streptomyces TaxID=2593676 RepID=UPI0024B87B14|nr:MULTISPECIES: DUF6531 domain-containing protein [unclassified Streptomyces]MDJ0342324.1 DUF6531 domain-containing protein [Streptomyces sp. PH10-H1]MDJ0372179.1 DUF6531 domain-containing protein [Streptomyces sp. H10-C2]